MKNSSGNQATGLAMMELSAPLGFCRNCISCWNIWLKKSVPPVDCAAGDCVASAFITVGAAWVRGADARATVDTAW
ncbi:hypothetical protein C1Y40_05769 [Mycobacterium talmoniae]|uniref:Uncharacterized protein n=1 Tax=Mycobacterium talmoniae TaxID=1858794 RepID=A0A2S8BBP4_9MYCO|nr:hypothetical protein C1Y40_05769 [Mycobacterium talmoniae]